MALDKTETSQKVLEIAERLLNQGGAPALQARAIAREAGISVGSIYNLVGDLDQLHGMANMRLLDRLGEAGLATSRKLKEKGVTDTRERLLALARTYLAFVQAHPVGWTALLAFSPGRMAADAQGAYETRLDTLFEIIASVLADDKTLMVDNARARLSARVLWSSVHGIVTNSAGRRAQQRQGEGVWDQIDLLVTTFLRGMEPR